MPEFDPRTNGHRLKSESTPVPRRGGGVLLLALVSALTGLNLLIGAGVGAIVGAVTDADDLTPALAAIGAGLGGAVGVAVGVKVTLRLGGSSGVSSARWLTAWGIAGLVGSIALAATLVTPLTPILAILLPGLAALLGDRYAAKKHIARHGPPAETEDPDDPEEPPD